MEGVSFAVLTPLSRLTNTQKFVIIEGCFYHLWVGLYLRCQLPDDTLGGVSVSGTNASPQRVLGRIPGLPFFRALPILTGIILSYHISSTFAQATTLNRPDDPVVLTGADLPWFVGLTPDDIVAWRHDGGWQQIPLQVDQHNWRDRSANRGLKSIHAAFFMGRSRPNQRIKGWL